MAVCLKGHCFETVSFSVTIVGHLLGRLRSNVCITYGLGDPFRTVYHNRS